MNAFASTSYRVFKKMVIIFLLMLANIASRHAVQAQPQTQIFEAGEVLEYRVSYAGITLGTVKLVTEKVDTLRGLGVVKVKAFIDTAPGIPFVEFHSIFESWADKSGVFSHEFLASSKMETGWDYDRYQFLYPQSAINMTSNGKGKPAQQTLQSSRRWNDGLSLFYTAREMLTSKRNVSVPTMVMGDTSRTIINFKDAQAQNIEIAALKQPVKTVYFAGEAKWRGIYGLAGGFEGWFSDDAARVPIRAKMQVIVGKVNIELVRWQRGSWQPPQGQ
jgi:hypothetical protein